MFDLPIYMTGLLLVSLMATASWVLSLVKHDVSIVDSVWGLFFLALCLSYVLSVQSPGYRALLVLILVSIWAIRLSVFITLRNRGEPEDARYQAIRARNEPWFAIKSLFIIFLLQATLAWIISLPLLAAVNSSPQAGVLDALAAALVLFGILFETIADSQLAAFKAKPDNSGKVMDTGLWRYTRHPNYFGECCVWWGFYLFALAAGGWWSVISPLLMTFLLLRVSGVALLEKDITERRPAYRDYIERTNAFIPGPPGVRQKTVNAR
ncbi:MAG: DUF1295 domain-containing protein [Gammaproteobacteria bacterium]